MKLTFQVYRGDLLVEEKAFDQTDISISTDRSADLRIEDAAAAGHGATVYLEAETSRVMVQAHPHPETVLVNEQEVRRYPLFDEDELTIGNTHIVVHGAPARPPEPDTSEVDDRVRHRGLRVIGKCSHCGMPLPFPGPVRKLHCSHCQGLNQRDPAFWANVLERANRDDPDSDDVKLEPPPPELAGDPVDAPHWLVSDDLPYTLRLFGATLEGPGGELAPTVPQEVRPVVMSCPKCAAALEVTGESERTVTCQYCQSAVYLPDPLWQQLHPVQQAPWWYVEYRGETPKERKWREYHARERAELAAFKAARQKARQLAAQRPSAPAEPGEPPRNRATIFVVLACVLVALGAAAYFLFR